MLKKRITACIIVKNNTAVQSIRFNRYLPIGSAQVAAEYFNIWGIDEIILIDIDSTKNNDKPNFELIKNVSSYCHVPLTVGGGISTIDDIRKMMQCGADKVSINNIALRKPSFIKEAASIFGEQCIVVSIDVVGNSYKNYSVYSYLEKKSLDLNPLDWAKKVESLGAGEIFLTSVERDGSKQGYDIDLINLIANSIKIPVIVGGGAGKPIHFLEVYHKTEACAICAANYFHFMEHSVIITKAFLKKNKEDIRIDTQTNYLSHNFIDDHKIDKLTDEILEDLLYEKIIQEII